MGQFISEDGLNNPLSNIGQRNNREVTLRKAKEAIRHLCSQLRLKDHLVEGIKQFGQKMDIFFSKYKNLKNLSVFF